MNSAASDNSRRAAITCYPEIGLPRVKVVVNPAYMWTEAESVGGVPSAGSRRVRTRATDQAVVSAVPGSDAAPPSLPLPLHSGKPQWFFDGRVP